ncbi:MAG: GTPase HflX [Rhizobiaceae bacterium]
MLVPIVAAGGQAVSTNGPATNPRLPEARLEEARGLTEAIDLHIVHDAVVPLNRPQAGTLIGKGKIAEISRVVADNSIEVVVVDHPLTPVQQRNLENAFQAKVLDRTGLILEIFGERARTKEGRLQVDLAHLNYQRGRLVRSWTHLERQRGGAGFLGGPGETQIEADRRILRDKIVRLKRELETVRRTRTLHRSKRKKVPYPVVAIVGYTNAGKSTLFNRLTGSEVMAKDMLFATLDPTLRRLKLPHGQTIILSDTVGFISDLPTHLVAAFRATLEEVVEADLVLHVRDMSDPDFAAQAGDVEQILSDLGIDPHNEKRVLEVWNKADLVNSDFETTILDQRKVAGGNAPVVISAMKGDGIDVLRERIEFLISGETSELIVHLDASELRLTDWLYRHSDIKERNDRADGGTDFVLRASADTKSEIEKRLGRPIAD